MVHPPLFIIQLHHWTRTSSRDIKYVSADRSIDHLVNDNKTRSADWTIIWWSLERSISREKTMVSQHELTFLSPTKRLLSEPGLEQNTVVISFFSCFSSPDMAMGSLCSSKDSTFKRFQCHKAGSVPCLKGTGKGQAGVFMNLPGISLHV